MKTLEVSSCCEIDDLIDVIVERTGRTYDEVETEAFACGLHPEGDKTYADLRWPESHKQSWFRDELYKIMREMSLQGLYITVAI